VGIKSVTVTTAVGMTRQEKDSIKGLVKRYFDAQKVELEEHIDEELLGGFIIQIEDQLLDASVKKQLEKVKDYLTRKQPITN
jgi:F-type H+-transporting ATPase subunit delta